MFALRSRIRTRIDRPTVGRIAAGSDFRAITCGDTKGVQSTEPLFIWSAMIAACSSRRSLAVSGASHSISRVIQFQSTFYGRK